MSNQEQQPSVNQQGHAGELHFEQNCNKAGIACNRVARDLRGWDYFIQLPLSISDDQSFDKRKGAVSALVQIKTISNGKYDFTTRLSSVEHLAKFPGPSFFYILRSKSGLDFDEAFLVHLSDNALIHVLTSLRKADAESERFVNRRRIRFDIRTGVKLSPSWVALLNALNLSCGDDQDKYIENKKQELKNVGYGKDRYQCSAIVHADHPDQLMEGYLGYRELRATAISIFEKRFGIKLPLEKSQNGTVRFGPVGSNKRPVVFQQQSRNSSINSASFDCAIYSTLGMAITEKRQKIRVNNEFFDIVLGNSGLTFTRSNDLLKDASLSLKEWINFLKMICLVLTGPVVMRFDFDGTEIRQCLPFKRSTAELRKMRDVLTIFELLEKLLVFANCNFLEGSFDQIVLNAQKIIEVHAFVFSKPRYRSVEWSSIEPFPVEVVSHNLEMVFFDHIPIGDFCFTVYSLVKFRIDSVDEIFGPLTSREVKLMGAGVCKTGEQYRSLKRYAFLEAGTDNYFERQIDWTD